MKKFGLVLLVILLSGCQSTPSGNSINNTVFNKNNEAVTTSTVHIKRNSNDEILLITSYINGGDIVKPKWIIKQEEIPLFTSRLTKYINKDEGKEVKLESIRISSVGGIAIFGLKEYLTFMTVMHGKFSFTKEECIKLLNELQYSSTQN